MARNYKGEYKNYHSKPKQKKRRAARNTARNRALKKGTVNIGDRQRGRVKAESVIDCEPNRESIYQAIQILYSDQFRRKLNKLDNPYGVGGASQLVVETLETFQFATNAKKIFYDLSSNQ